MKNKDEYIIKVNSKTLGLISESLELFTRLKVGQLEELKWFYEADDIEEEIKALKNKVFPELSYNKNYGIYSEKVPYEAKVAYDLYKTIHNKGKTDHLKASEEKLEIS